jgi:3-oxoacid CoA-transferase subunit A
MPNKVYPSPRAALEGVLFDGMTIMSGCVGVGQGLAFVVERT